MIAMIAITVVHYLAQLLIHCCLICKLGTWNDSGRALLGSAVVQLLIHCCLICKLGTCNDGGRALLGSAVDPLLSDL